MDAGTGPVGAWPALALRCGRVLRRRRLPCGLAETQAPLSAEQSPGPDEGRWLIGGSQNQTQLGLGLSDTSAGQVSLTRSAHLGAGRSRPPESPDPLTGPLLVSRAGHTPLRRV